MSTVNTYADLQAAIGRWMARTDLATNISDFISAFEQVANRRLRVRQQEALATLTPGPITADRSGVALPVDYLAWRRVTWAGSSLGTSSQNVELEYVEPTYLGFRFPVMNNSVGVPQCFAIEDGHLLIPTLDTTPLELSYFQKIPSLNDPSTSGVNWLLSNHWDLYLSGSLYEYWSYTEDPEKAAFWKARRDENFDEVITLSNKTRGVGGMRVMGPTP
jgi:hypothetical protein